MSRNFLSTDFFLESEDDVDEDDDDFGDEDDEEEEFRWNRFGINEAIDCAPFGTNFFFILIRTLLLLFVPAVFSFLSSPLPRFKADFKDFAILPHRVSVSKPLGTLLIAFPIAEGIMNGAAKYATMSLAQLFTVSRSNTESTFFFFAFCEPLELP